MERLQTLAEASSSLKKAPLPPASRPSSGSPGKRRSNVFTEEDRRIVARSISDMAKSQGESPGFTALWKDLARQYPRHSAHSWRACYKEMNKVENDNLITKKSKAPFSLEDEEALIEFLAAGGPKPNLSWKDFAVNHPERRVEAWQMYSYRNRDRLVDRIKARRQQLSPEERGDDDLDDDDDEPGTSRRSMRSRRSGVHFNEADRKVLEEALDAIPNPRDARALTRLWTQLEAEHPERSAPSWKKCYLKFRDELGQGASRTSPRRPSRYGAAYTVAEEDALINFLASKNEPDVSWTDFTKSNPGRTKEAWRQHWYGNRERLLRRAQELGVEVKEEGSIFSDSFRVGRSSAASVGSVETETHTATTSRSGTTLRHTWNEEDDPSSFESSDPEPNAEGDDDDDDMESSGPPSPAHHHVFTLPKLQSNGSESRSSKFDAKEAQSFDPLPDLPPPPFIVAQSNISPRTGKRKLEAVTPNSPFVIIGGEPLIPADRIVDPLEHVLGGSSSSAGAGEPSAKRSRSVGADTPGAAGTSASHMNIRAPPNAKMLDGAGAGNARSSASPLSAEAGPSAKPLPFSDEDRAALGNLLTEEGPNPPPGSLLRFVAKHPSHSLEEWLHFLGEEGAQLLSPNSASPISTIASPTTAAPSLATSPTTASPSASTSPNTMAP